MQLNVTLIANIVSIILIIVTAYFNASRHNYILPLSTKVISKDEKDEMLKQFQNNRYVFYIAAALNILNFFLPDNMFKFIIPAITAMVMFTIMSSLFVEIADNQVSEKDISAAEAHKRQKREEIRNKAIARKEAEEKKLAEQEAENAEETNKSE